jgi:lipase maturation factor 1
MRAEPERGVKLAFGLRTHQNGNMSSTEPSGSGGSAGTPRPTSEPCDSDTGVRPTTPRPTLVWVRYFFLRTLALIYLAAFWSLNSQIMGLAGHNGIVPATQAMSNVRAYAGQQNLGVSRYFLEPTLCWISASDRFLRGLCVVGMAASVLLLFGIASPLCVAALWLLYLSLTTVCGVFLQFQWDNLLLETGLLAILLGPFNLFSRPARERDPSLIIVWLFRWLLFRLMFQSGCVKLLSGDSLWRNLTALSVHYETQPLPTWIGWYAHQLPMWAQKSSCALMFFVELVVPFLIFAPRRVRMWAVPPLVGLQVVIMLTGNYCFFNWLTIALCLFLVDDQILRRPWPSAAPLSKRLLLVRNVAFGVVAAVLALLSLLPLMSMFGLRSWPRPVIAMYQAAAPFRSVNGYGLFAVMTPSRPEIIVEGSNDGQRWLRYEFKYKPGELNRRPQFVAPHQPRLDWQMWFAALGDYHGNPWFVNFCIRLLQGRPEVLALLEKNPFPDSPPKYIRASVYDYRFTGFGSRDWWRRELKGGYLPPISLKQAE